MCGRQLESIGVTMRGNVQSLLQIAHLQSNVSLLIRAFQNTDTQALCRVFNSHHEAVGLPSAIVPLSLELCVLAKPYFENPLLLVAEQDQRIVGFTQVGFEPADGLTSLDTSASVISALCVEPGEEDFAVGQILIEEAIRCLAGRGAEKVRFCPPPPATPYFAGLAPGDGMIGCPTIDPRVRSWLEASQWKVEQPMACWEIDLNSFQLPMDRTQLQVRRMAHVDRLLDEPVLPWYAASMLGHTEPIGFQLTSRQTRMVTAEIMLWTIGHELLPQNETVAHLWPLESLQPGQDDHVVFLIAESLRQLREDRIDIVRTIVAGNDAATAKLLSRIGFTATLSGVVFTRAV